MKINLHQYPRIWGLTSLSPFCIKVEAFMVFNKIPYEIVIEKSPNKGPKGKMPFIEDGSTVIPDSSDIIAYLSNKYGLEDQRIFSPDAYSYLAMLEESFYFILLYSRWVDKHGYNVIKNDFGNLFLPLYGPYFMGIIRRNLIKQANMQGIGRHSKEEVYKRGMDQLKAFDVKLGNNKFFFGDQISEIDFSMYGFLVTISKTPIETTIYTEYKK
jgi:glutathione S-transferase